MPGIPTTYKGIRFRSRVEARWAAFFDELGWLWDYEPIDLDGYIPDFVLRFKRPLLVEVKGNYDFMSGLQSAKAKILHSGWTGEAIVVGPALDLFDSEGIKSGPVIGSMITCSAESTEDNFGIDDDCLQIFWCDICGRHSANASLGSYGCRLNGCGDGDHHVGNADRIAIGEMWARACNKTQHNARRG